MKHSTLSISSGYTQLDQELPQAGWPVGALTEILVPRIGQGELSLLGPLLRRLAESGRTIALLVPPYLSYAPALIQQGVRLEHVRVIRMAQPLNGLWQIEKDVQEGRFGAIVAVLPTPAGGKYGGENSVHSLQLAARLSNCPAFLFHSGSTPATTQAAQLRLLAETSQPGVIHVQRIATDARTAQPNAVLLEIERHAAPAPLTRAQARIPARAGAPVEQTLAGNRHMVPAKTGLGFARIDFIRLRRPISSYVLSRPQDRP